MQERNRSVDIKNRIFPTPEQAREQYSEMAKEVLTGVPVFERMSDHFAQSLIEDTATVIAGIVFNYKGHYRNASPEVAWSALTQSYTRKKARESAAGRFKLALGSSAEGVYKTSFTMLEVGVKTREELVKKTKPPKDELQGLRSGVKRDDNISVKSRSADDNLSPLVSELPEF